MPTKNKKIKVKQIFNKSIQLFKKVSSAPGFDKKYAVVSVVILFATTFLWSLLGAKVQQGNADQLVNPYLFEHANTFHKALIPAQHTFFIKWPLFLLVKLLGYSSFAYISVTVLSVLATVGIFAFILYKIESRPRIFGTLCLALTSVLLLIPAQPYAGALLPVNMAMIATRNLEYVIYIASLFMLIRSWRIRAWSFWTGVLILAVLMASDKLFLTLSLGGAAIALVVYALASGWNLVGLSVRWLVGSFVAAAGALGIIQVLDKFTIVTGSGALGPYGVVHSSHDLILGAVYGVLGLLTNFGANPAYDTTVIKNMPHQLISRLTGIGGPAYIINGLILATGLFIVWRVVKSSIVHNKNADIKLSQPYRLSIAVIWTSVAALGAFVISNHYFAVDARYLTIILFAVFISAAAFTSQRQWHPERVATVGIIICVGILFGIATLFKTQAGENKALAIINQRDKLVAQALKHHHVDVLVGDYWRVVPTKLMSGNTIDVMPLTDCTDPRQNLTSQAWQTDINKHSFAYLLSLDKSLTDYLNCSLDQITKSYGRPNSSVVIAGSQDNPTELLLFYDLGIHKSTHTPATKTPSTVLPITLDQLPYTSCPNGTTIMNIVAHQDDDLLFMNPDINSALKEGHCIRTIYLTAGDGGGDQFYWLGREQGSEAAYSAMLNSSALWVKRIVQLAPHAYVMISHPMSDYRVSLIFMRLPDGNINGSGFKRYLYQGLARLESGKVNVIDSVDNQSSFTSTQLTDALVSLMKTYQPVEIRTQANFVSKIYPDHSDHMAVGRYVKRAYAKYEAQQFENNVQIPLKYYIGYPARGLPAIISGAELILKEKIFDAYNNYDPAVCQTAEACFKSPTYGSYLARQYQNAY